MQQYHPEYKAFEIEDINRRVSDEEVSEVAGYAKKLGLNFITSQHVIKFKYIGKLPARFNGKKEEKGKKDIVQDIWKKAKEKESSK